jgi:hypothetical protein
MYSKFWLVIKDDGRRTFEVCGQSSNDNAFSNRVVGMQRAKMNVSGVALPITNRTSNRDAVAITGYTKEDGLWERLQQEHSKIIRDEHGMWEDEL